MHVGGQPKAQVSYRSVAVIVRRVRGEVSGDRSSPSLFRLLRKDMGEWLSRVSKLGNLQTSSAQPGMPEFVYLARYLLRMPE